MEIQETKMVWVAWTNTDCTEGRGEEIPLFVCEHRETARRLGRGKYVQGSDCRVTLEVAVKVKNTWFYPGRLHLATTEDIKKQKADDSRMIAIERAKAAGLTEQDIELIKNGG